MSSFVQELGMSMMRDAVGMMVGKEIGAGIGRRVFVYNRDPKLVIKFESNGYQNAVEREIWHAVKHAPQYRKWFAPVVDLSAFASVLLMERTLPAPRSSFPKMMPDFLGDLKYSNFGMLGGRLVCHDYGTVANFLHGFSRTKVKLRSAKWWDASDGSSFDDGARA